MRYRGFLSATIDTVGNTNLLLKDPSQMPYFTDMRAIFRALPGLCSHHDWLVSELECVFVGDATDDMPDGRLNNGFVRGEILHEIVETRDIQFCWGVFSALPKGVTPEYYADTELPWADGNRNLWIGSPRPQLRDAALEIVCWDATCTLLIGLGDDQATSFLRCFPTAVDLDTHNRDLAATTEPRLSPR